MLTIRWQVGRSIVQAVGELAEKFFSFAYVGAKVTYGNVLIDNYGVFAFKVSIVDIITRRIVLPLSRLVLYLW